MTVHHLTGDAASTYAILLAGCVISWISAEALFGGLISAVLGLVAGAWLIYVGAAHLPWLRVAGWRPWR
jgi:hypothetical protein